MNIMTEGNHRVITVGIDLAKNVFAVHGVDDNGKAVLVKPKVSREQLLPLLVQFPPCDHRRNRSRQERLCRARR